MSKLTVDDVTELLGAAQDGSLYQSAQKNLDELGFMLFILSAIFCGQRFSANNKDEGEG